MTQAVQLVTASSFLQGIVSAASSMHLSPVFPALFVSPELHFAHLAPLNEDALLQGVVSFQADFVKGLAQWR